MDESSRVIVIDRGEYECATIARLREVSLEISGGNYLEKMGKFVPRTDGLTSRERTEGTGSQFTDASVFLFQTRPRP